LPPVDGRRKKILNAVVAQLKTATTAEYFYNYSLVTFLSKDSLNERIDKTQNVSLNVADGAESTQRKMKEAHVTMDVEIQVTVKAKADELVASLQNAFADVSRVLGKLPDLGVECTSTIVSSIEKPFYDFTNRYAVAIMHLRAEYDYLPGVDT
jgi:hypothetical protein